MSGSKIHTPPYGSLYRVKLFFIAIIVLFSAVLITIINPGITSAADGCPDGEYPGTKSNSKSPDPNKCYKSKTITVHGEGNQTVVTETGNKPTKTNPSNPTNPTNPTNPSNPSNPTDPADPSTETNEGSPCAIEKVGWILCPIIETAAKAGDNLFNFLADNFLQVEPELIAVNPTNDAGQKVKGTQTAWEYARNLANIMFVIAFVIIIYSQITGTGLNNYGIKRMLPRLIVAAIAVNVSYYICQFMVDISNLLGYSIKAALSSIANDIGPKVMGQSAQGTNTQTSDGVLAKIAIAALAVAGVIWIILGPMGAVVTFIVITCLVIIIILLLRKAFIILLVVLSPIAFVMYLLPNTEKYFSKWLNMFWQLLMVFPIVALLLGAGQLASTIILVAGTSQGNTSQQAAAGNSNCEENQGGTPDPNANPDPNATPDPNTTSSVNQEPGSYGVSGECTVNIGGLQSGWTLGLVAAGIAVAPLLAVWSVLQGALSAAGAIGGKITSAVSKGSGSIGSKVGKGVDAGAGALKKRAGQNMNAAWQRSQARGLAGEGGKFDRVAGKYARRSALRQARLNASQGDLARTQSDFLADKDVQAGVTAGLTSAGVARAAALAQEKSGSEEVKSEMLAIEHAEVGKLQAAQDAFDSALASGDQAKAKAATSALMTTGETGVAELAKRLQTAQENANRTGNHELADTLKEYLMQAHGDVKGKNAAVHAWATSGHGNSATVADKAADANTYAKLSDAQFATQTEASLNNAGAKAAMSIKTTNAEGLQETRGHRLLSNPESAKNFSDEKRTIIANNGGNTAPHP